MTKKEFEDKFFIEFLKWCATAPKGPADLRLVFWLDHHFPTEENFWEWAITHKKTELAC